MTPSDLHFYMNSPSPAIKVFNIPELFRFIHPYLSAVELSRCSRVSNEFSKLFTPLLWRTVSLKTQAQHRHFTETLEVRNALAKNSQYIEVIQIQTCGSLAPFLTVDAIDLKNLRALEFPWPIQPEFYTQFEPDDGDTCRISTMDWLHEPHLFNMRHLIAQRTSRHRRQTHEHERQEILESQVSVLDEVVYTPLFNALRNTVTQNQELLLRMLFATTHLQFLLEIMQQFPSTPYYRETFQYLVQRQANCSSQLYYLDRSLSEFQQNEDVDSSRLVLTPEMFEYYQHLVVYQSNQQQLVREQLERQQIPDPLHLLSHQQQEISPSWEGNHTEDERLLSQFLKRVPHLRGFGNTRFPISRCEITNTLISQFSFSSLQSLSLVNHEPISEYCLEHIGQLLDRCPPQLEYLRLSGTAENSSFKNRCPKDNIKWSRETTNTSMRRKREDTGIKKLIFEGNMALEVRPQFLDRCPKLQSLSLCMHSEVGIGNLIQSIKRCPLLEEVAIYLIQISSSGRQVFDLLASCCVGVSPQQSSNPGIVARGGLKKLIICGLFFPTNQESIIKALRKHSSTLTHLAIKNFQDAKQLEEGGPSLICRILESFKRLEYLDISLSDNMPISPNPGFISSNFICSNFISAVKLIQPEFTWPFESTLRVLRILITLADGEDTLRESSSNRSIQVRVCKLLGLLTYLEELSLGIDEDNGLLFGTHSRLGYQDKCLELTRPTGLCKMSNLKQLRLFKVSRMNHRLGLDELKWMRDSWPNLREIRGLLRFEGNRAFRFDNDKSKPELESEDEMIEWIKENYPDLQYT